jgi:hypothetical protein
LGCELDVKIGAIMMDEAGVAPAKVPNIGRSIPNPDR